MVLRRVSPRTLAAQHHRSAQDDRFALHSDLDLGVANRAKPPTHSNRQGQPVRLTRSDHSRIGGLLVWRSGRPPTRTPGPTG